MFERKSEVRKLRVLEISKNEIGAKFVDNLFFLTQRK